MRQAASFCGGSLSVLVNNAGIADPNLAGSPAERRSRWSRVLNVNLSGVLCNAPALHAPRFG